MDILAPYLREIDQNRWYTNFGPLETRFEQRLARHFGVTDPQLAALSNGTTALSAALVAVGAKPGSTCLVPAWTFVASAAAVCAANMIPHFIDVDPQTWMPDPQALLRRSDLRQIGAVMVVGPFGMPVDTGAWERFTEESGIPVIVDAAACFDAVASLENSRPGRSPVIVSLHATKSFGTGEGGLVISTDDQVVHRVRQVGNFGIWGSPEGQIVGYNGKLSEYHAAVGLAALDGWPERRQALMGRTQRYVSELKRLRRARPLPGFGAGWVSVYCTVSIDGDLSPIMERLTGLGIETRRWWQNGVHVQAAYRQFPRDDLPVTTDLATHSLSLPFSHDITDDQIARVIESLADVLGEPA